MIAVKGGGGGTNIYDIIKKKKIFRITRKIINKSFDHQPAETKSELTNLTQRSFS